MHAHECENPVDVPSDETLRSSLQLVLSEEMQTLMGVMLHVADLLISMMENMLPAIDQLEGYMHSIQDLNLMTNNEFKQVRRRQHCQGSVIFLLIHHPAPVLPPR